MLNISPTPTKIKSLSYNFTSDKDVFLPFSQKLNTSTSKDTFQKQDSITSGLTVGKIITGIAAGAVFIISGLSLLKKKGKNCINQSLQPVKKYTEEEIDQLWGKDSATIIENAMPKLKLFFEKYGVDPKLMAQMHELDLEDIVQAKSFNKIKGIFSLPRNIKIFATRDVLTQAAKDAVEHFREMFLNKGLLKNILDDNGTIRLSYPPKYDIIKKFNLPETTLHEFTQALDQALSDPAKLKLIKKDIIKDQMNNQLARLVKEKLERVLSEMNFFNI